MSYANISGNMELNCVPFENKKGDKGVTIYPKELGITWVNDKRYWKWFWILLESQDYKVVEIPRLLDVCWLEIWGKYAMAKLTGGVKYEIVFVLMMSDLACGWDDSPVTLGLELPDGTSKSHEINLSNLPRNEWKMLPVGEFKASAGVGGGDIKFSLMEINKGNWKNGLIIKGAVIRPIYN